MSFPFEYDEQTLSDTLTVAEEDTLEKETRASVKTGLPANLNSTAYRIFKLLVWLNEGPLTLDELNDKLLQDTNVGKTLSNDSIWLYINTLKALGCDIRRPTRSNGYRYILKYHPFGMYLQQFHLDLLSEVKARLERHGTSDDILHFDRFLKKIVSRSALENREQFWTKLFQNTRSLDYDEISDLIQSIKTAIEKSRLLSCVYRSPVRGKETFYVLPDELMYQNGVLYVLGQQHGRSEACMLRVDKIEQADIIERPEILKRLLRQREELQTVRIRFFDTMAEEMPSFGMGEVLSETAGDLNGDDTVTTNVVEMTLKTRHFFLLRQKILESGLVFQVLSPASFVDSMRVMLSQMARLYEFDVEGQA